MFNERHRVNRPLWSENCVTGYEDKVEPFVAASIFRISPTFCQLPHISIYSDQDRIVLDCGSGHYVVFRRWAQDITKQNDAVLSRTKWFGNLGGRTLVKQHNERRSPVAQAASL